MNDECLDSQIGNVAEIEREKRCFAEHIYRVATGQCYRGREEGSFQAKKEKARE